MFDRSAIMRRAWALHRQNPAASFGPALCRAWAEAKAPRRNVRAPDMGRVFGGFRWNALDHADEYRAAAKARRERGGSTVRIVASTARLGLAPVVAAERAEILAVIAARSLAADAAENAARAAFPDRYEGFGF